MAKQFSGGDVKEFVAKVGSRSFVREKYRDALKEAGLGKYVPRSGSGVAASAWKVKKRIGKALVNAGVASAWRVNKIFRQQLKEKAQEELAKGGKAEEIGKKLGVPSKEELREQEREERKQRLRAAYGKRVAIDERIKAYMLEKTEDDQKRMKEEAAKKKTSSSPFNTPEAEKALDTVFMD